jgi:hypothetical protein
MQSPTGDQLVAVVVGIIAWPCQRRAPLWSRRSGTAPTCGALQIARIGVAGASGIAGRRAR